LLAGQSKSPRLQARLKTRSSVCLQSVYQRLADDLSMCEDSSLVNNKNEDFSIFFIFCIFRCLSLYLPGEVIFGGFYDVNAPENNAK
jgi:hypothetical protein